MIAFLQHRVGDLIEERYEVQCVLGSGAFGTVYQCRDAELDTVVAVKELHVLDDPDTHDEPREAALAQFRREAVNLSRLRHPHIVWGHYQPHAGTWLVCPICGFSFKGVPRCPDHNAAPIVLRQRHYLVMEYLDGFDLGEAAEASGGILPVESALRYIRQTAEALKLIHERGLVHRDIKPENVRLRAGSDDAVLLDFGITTETGEAGDFSTRVQRHTTGGGTFGYAPDSLHERRYPDARSDIHALGMTLYRLVSGLDPLETADLMDMRRLKPRDFNPLVTPGLEAVILKSISLDAADRQQNAAEFLHDLNSLSHAASPAVAMSQATSPVFGALAPEFAFTSGERARNLQE
ncbi:MAG TPA: serine/threonine-protein kinase, partial [Abditibacteriaceae bacterium]